MLVWVRVLLPLPFPNREKTMEQGFTMEELREIQRAFKCYVSSEDNGFNVIDSLGLSTSRDYEQRRDLHTLAERIANIDNLLPLLRKE